MDYRNKVYSRYVTLQVSPRGSGFTEKDYRDWADAAHNHIKEWLPKARNIAVLDLGCGAGKLLYLFDRKEYTDLTGVDLSPEQIELARNRFPQAKILQADVQEFLKKSVRQYDLICAFDLIEHFHKEEVIPLLESVYRALKPGGRLILQTPNAESPWFGAVAYGDFTHEWFFTPTGLENVLRLVGFDQYQARESGPYIHGAKSLTRYLLWRLFHFGMTVWNLAETGGVGSRVYSRVFLASVIKN